MDLVVARILSSPCRSDFVVAWISSSLGFGPLDFVARILLLGFSSHGFRPLDFVVARILVVTRIWSSLGFGRRADLVPWILSSLGIYLYIGHRQHTFVPSTLYGTPLFALVLIVILLVPFLILIWI
jgi:hypothetical protein